MSTSYKFLLSLVLVLVIAVLMVLLKDFTQQFIIIPVIYLFWVVGLIYRSIDQKFIWFGAALLVLVIMQRGLQQEKKTQKDAAQTSRQVLEGRRLSFWITHAYLINPKDNKQKYLSQALTALVTDILAFRHRFSAREMREKLRSGDVQTPDFISATFEDYSSPIFRQPGPSPILKIWQHFLVFLKLKNLPEVPDSDLDQLLNYLEEQFDDKNIQSN